MLGTTALQIFNETVSMPWAVMRWTEFYKHESCGKCTPCREGTYWLLQILERMLHHEGTPADLETLLDICDNILGRSFCALGDGATSPITSGDQVLPPGVPGPVHRAARRCRHPDQLPELAGASRMTTSLEKPEARPVPEGHVRLHDRRLRGRRAQGHAAHPGLPSGSGSSIPRFCDHPLLDPAGACRQCLVEVEMGGRPCPSRRPPAR